MSSEKQTKNQTQCRNGTDLYIARVLIFSAIFLPLLIVGALVGLVTGLPDSTGLRNDAMYIREQARNFTRTLLPDDSLRNEAVRLRLAGALYDNPEAYYRSSLVEQADGNLEKALTDIELALGLLELAPHEHARLIEYDRRRSDLKKMLSRQATE
jgi:hypothetical protein